MLQQNQKLLGFFDMLVDALLIFLSYPVAVWLRFEVLNGQRGLDMMSKSYLAMAAVYAAGVVFAFYCAGLYSSRRMRRFGSVLLAMCSLNAVGTLTLMAFMYITRIMEFPRLAWFLFWLASSGFLVAKHLLVHAATGYYRRKGYNLKRVVLVGSGPLARQYAQSIAANPQMGFRLEGYVGAEGAEILGERLGAYADLGGVLQQRVPDEMVVALEPYETDYLKTVLAAADKEGVRLSIIPFYSEYIPAHPSIDVIGQSKLINMRSTPLDNIGWAALKRLADIVGSLLLIVVTSPLMLITAVGVKLSSPGPILFKQERVGRNKKPFQMLKFRSMRVNAAETTAWTTEADPRKTRFGSFIRKFSIDELPQFFNVLMGDMSLVGPRPEIPYHVDHFKEEIPLYLVRQQIRPGITGWAQVNGLRGDTSIHARVEYDIWYIENWSIGLDLYILLRTAFGGWINNEQAPDAKAEKNGGSA